ncbi:O-antigen polymerase [Clostridium tyrobutyricum]|uniref:O-antigen polymerase n=1 Tax=Clostridium tyrobutyricum TaxID=1519 RepID=UPI001FAB2DF2|nr:O-antigen polymerase [Clostridium tyrobutyricum]
MLLVAVVFLCILSLASSKGAVLSPQFGFATCFIPGIIYALMYVDKWNLQLSGYTLFTIILGVSIFITVSTITSWLCRIYKKEKLRRGRITEGNVIGNVNDYITQWKLALIIILQLFTLVSTLLFLFRNFGTDLSAAMMSFRISNNDITSTNYITLPGTIRAIRRVCLASGFIMTYLFTNGLVYNNKKNRVAELLCIFLTLLNSLTLGGRGDALQLITAGVMQYLIIERHKEGRKFIKIGNILKIMVITIVIIATFAQVGELLGRNMSFINFNDYIAVYLSAELKNLDTFIRSGVFGTNFISSQTMVNVVNLLGSLLGNTDWIHNLDNPYRFMNGYSLGNVSTVFYAFMYDGGYIGTVIYTSIMAIICQIIFQGATNANTEKKISLSVVLYSYVWFTVIFSFFSDKFYEIIINTNFVWMLFSWLVIRAFLLVKLK